MKQPEYRKEILKELANAYGIQTVYYDVNNKRQTCSDKSILSTLKALGVIEDEDLAGALQEYNNKYWQQKIEPVIVIWDESLAAIPLRLTQQEALSTVHCHLHYEEGAEQEWDVDLS